MQNTITKELVTTKRYLRSKEFRTMKPSKMTKSTPVCISRVQSVIFRSLHPSSCAFHSCTVWYDCWVSQTQRWRFVLLLQIVLWTIQSVPKHVSTTLLGPLIWKNSFEITIYDSQKIDRIDWGHDNRRKGMKLEVKRQTYHSFHFINLLLCPISFYTLLIPLRRQRLVQLL